MQQSLLPSQPPPKEMQDFDLNYPDAELVFGLLRAEGAGGNLTTDAHLAALAIEANATVHTADTDFLRFAGLKWINPLN